VTMSSNDRRRYGVVVVQFRSRGGVAMYDLTINGELWACVEWSPSRRAWCIQDAAGECLTHVESIHGQNVDAQTAVALAKRMIVDGTMPTPEDAARQLAERLEQSRAAQCDPAELPGELGEPWTMLPEPVLVPRSSTNHNRKK
jgi:hypothetical protein